MSASGALLAVDIGNSRIKIGVFLDALAASQTQLPVCHQVLVASSELPVVPWDKMPPEFVDQHPRCIVSSVNPPATQRFLDEFPGLEWPEPLVIRSFRELPIVNLASSPEQTGLDRLLKGVAANVLRSTGQPLILVDSGTATTVDWITESGEFAGGAILPGLSLSSRALHDHTASLPLIPSESLEHDIPKPLGKNTQQALQSGLYWGHVGAVRELIVKLAAQHGRSVPSVLVTGGAGRLLARELDLAANYHQDLTLQGLAISARHILKP